MTLPVAAFLNKDYQLLFDSEQRFKSFAAAVSHIAKDLQINTTHGHATFHDDLLVWFRNLFFLTDERFQAAFSEFNEDTTLRARMWRIYNLCWALNQGLNVAGDVVDVGCYDGKTTKVFCNYNNPEVLGRNLYVFDFFDHAPEESRKASHGPDLAAVVEKRLKAYRPVVVEGDVTQTIPAALPDRICFAHVDLNYAEAEAHVFPKVYARMERGAVAVFDDFGFRRYRQSAEAHREFLLDKPEKILELPTGQGLFIKV